MDVQIVDYASVKPQIDFSYASKSFLVSFERETTRETYGIALNQWLGWCQEQGINPMSVERGYIELFARELRQTGRSKATVANKLTTLRSFYRYCHEEGYISRNPSQYVKVPKLEFKSSSEALSRTEYFDVLDSARKTSFREQAIIAMLGLTGVRVSTLCKLDVEDLRMFEGSIVIKYWLKGDKYIDVKAPVELSWPLQRYMEDYNLTTGPLFMNNYNNRMNRPALVAIIQKHVRKCGITKRITPHSFRHTFITMARAAGVPDREILAVTGHSSFRMLEYYDAADRVMLSGSATQRVSAFINGAN